MFVFVSLSLRKSTWLLLPVTRRWAGRAWSLRRTGADRRYLCRLPCSSFRRGVDQCVGAAWTGPTALRRHCTRFCRLTPTIPVALPLLGLLKRRGVVKRLLDTPVMILLAVVSSGTQEGGGVEGGRAGSTGCTVTWFMWLTDRKRVRQHVPMHSMLAMPPWDVRGEGGHVLL